jgi:hypothetical protein
MKAVSVAANKLNKLIGNVHRIRRGTADQDYLRSDGTLMQS